MKAALEHIISGCKRQDPTSQKALYDLYKDVLFPICLRYVKKAEDAEDVFIEGFFKIFNKIDEYKGEGSFEGWMKRIMVNESLMFLRKNHNLKMTVELTGIDQADDVRPDDAILYEELLEALADLPVGYKTIFNLYVIEGYKHREIAELLGISINTSKSQLILAKKRIQDIIKKKDNIKYSLK